MISVSLEQGRVLNMLAPTAGEAGLQLGTMIVAIAVLVALVFAALRGVEEA